MRFTCFSVPRACARVHPAHLRASPAASRRMRRREERNPTGRAKSAAPRSAVVQEMPDGTNDQRGLSFTRRFGLAALSRWGVTAHGGPGGPLQFDRPGSRPGRQPGRELLRRCLDPEVLQRSVHRTAPFNSRFLVFLPFAHRGLSHVLSCCAQPVRFPPAQIVEDAPGSLAPQMDIGYFRTHGV